MRAIGTVLWLVVLGISVYNWWQIRALRAELAAQRHVVQVSERSPGLLRKLEVTLQRGERARKFLEQGKHREARQELDRAMTEFGEAAHGADAATQERLQKVEETFSRIRDQTRGLLGRATEKEQKRSGGG